MHQGHDYRVAVSDLDRGRPIWFCGSGCTEAGIDQIFAELGPKKSAQIELAVMDMWRSFRNRNP
ncbi:transposase [Variovorax sp. AB1(2024)]|uniref:transposase n=1 Tax=Stenotrophomonas sp. AB1(2024) TaxID=3132215 RepID=UPI00309FADC6